MVRSDYVQYTVDPDNITVKRGYADPVKVDQEYEADENGEASLLDTESLQLDTPEDVWLYEEDGYLCLEYSHCLLYTSFIMAQAHLPTQKFAKTSSTTASVTCRPSSSSRASRASSMQMFTASMVMPMRWASRASSTALQARRTQPR